MQKSKKLLSALMALVMVLTAFPIMAFATSEVNKPADASTSAQPFVTGKPSQTYRIPNIITLNDGTLIAAADARWSSGMDGGGNDVIVSRSTDNGNTWRYSLLNYFGDNGNTFNKASTSFCDSALATDGQKVYLLSTFFPAGYAINSSSANNRPVAESAFDNAGRLKLRLNGVATWDYYLDTNTKNRFGNYVIRRYSNNSITEDYSVDTEFFLHDASNGKNGSIFYNDGAYQTVKTTFLWFRSSDDGGITWNAPKLLNVKLDSEMFLGVGPGRGVVTNSGDIVFATYRWNRQTTLGIENNDKQVHFQKTYLISSSDGGYTWNRTSGNATNDAYWSSEGAPLELPNGDIRVFLRAENNFLQYSDARRNADGTYTWLNNFQEVVASNGDKIDNYNDCQKSAIMYPYKVDGKNAILVSTPINRTGRMNGNIHLILLNDDNTVDSFLRYSVNGLTEPFDYSCMTVLDNGDIGLLYENAGGSIRYITVPISSIAGGRTVDKPEKHTIRLQPGESTSVKINNGLSITNSSSSVASVSTQQMQEAKCQRRSDSTQFALSDALYTFTSSGGGWIIGNNKISSIGQEYLHHAYNGNDWGTPNYKGESAIITITQSTNSSSDGSLMNFKDGSYTLMFGKGDGGACEDIWDRCTDPNSDSVYGPIGTSYRNASALLLYRPVNVGETSSTEIPGYVKLTSISQITSGSEYLIVAKDDSSANNYFVLFPSADGSSNDTARRSHVAQVLPTQLVDKGTQMTISAAAEGTTKIMVGDNIEYNVIVSQMDQVSGAVKYDPVIYTQGANYTELGSNIAQGTADGEYKTAYELAPGWTIDGIDVTTPEIINPQDSSSTVNAVGTSVSASNATGNGQLTGTVSINYTGDSKTEWVKVLVKTTLIGPDGKTYIQQNHLYVTTSPIPAHGAAGTLRWTQQWGKKLAITGLVFSAKGSTSTYAEDPNHNGTTGGKGAGGPSAVGTTNDNEDWSQFSNRGLANAKYLGQEGTLLVKDLNNDLSGDNDFFSRTSGKLGGTGSWFYSGGTGWGSQYTKTIDFAPIGNYYFDTSSTYNHGIESGSNANSVTIKVAMKIAKPTSTSGSLTSFRVQESKKSLTLDVVNDSNATTVSDWNNMGPFLTFDTDTATNTYQEIPLTYSRSNAVNNVVSASMYVQVLHNRDGTGAASRVALPFRIKFDDSKQSVRTAYNNAMTNNGSQTFDVLISSDYTTDTWNTYQTGRLNAEGWLNNYDYNQPTLTGNNGNMLATNYANLTRVCDFTELDEILRAKKSLSEQYGGAEFPYGTSSYNVYTQSSWSNFQALYYNANRFANVLHAVVNPTSTPRPNLPGYTPGAHSTTKNANQETIDKAVVDLTNYPVYAADPTNFEAAKALSKTLDLDAYNLVEPIGTEIASGDSEIYFEGKPENKIVDIPAKDQKIIDDHTAALLNTMNVATDGNTDPDNNKGKVCNVTVHKYNGDVKELKFSQCYAYDTQLMIDLAPYIDDSETATIVITNDNSTTTIPLTDDKVIPVLAASGNVDITITTTQKPAVVVYDYYGTILFSGFVNEKSDIVCDDAAKTVTIGGTVVDAKPSPSIKFDHWLIVTEDDGTYKVLQRGIRVGSDYSIVVAKGTNADGNEVAIGTVTHFGETEPTETFSGLNRQYTVKAADTITPLVWKMSVSNENQTAREYLAAYGSTFSRFTSNYDVIYTPLTDEDQVTAFGDAYGKPISYGDGYKSGDNNDKFTLSCSYSQAPDTIIREAGVLYSTNGDLNAETMLKGAEGVAAKKQTKVSEDGTYTMTKTGANTGTHLMRSYVTYTTKELGATIIRVSYGPVYKCVDGQVSIVD